MKSKALTILITATLVTTASAQLRPKHRFTLNSYRLAQAIVKALSQQGIEADPTHIALLGNVIATDPSPSFKIVSIRPQLSTTHTAIELACLRPTTCLPFYALVDTPTSIAKPSLVLTSTPTTKPPIVMRTGTSALLLMDDGREHLQISVISMESGPAGRTIRVRTPDHRRIYSAQILNANTLEARF
jgi:hypothetical protein